jgi:hypothetical protein
MKKCIPILFLLFLSMITCPFDIKKTFKSIAKTGEDLADKTKELGEKAVQETVEFGEKAVQETRKAGDKVVDETKGLIDTLTNIPAQAWKMLTEFREIYDKMAGKKPVEPMVRCPFIPAAKRAPSIENPQVQEEDQYDIISLIKKFSPVIYLHSKDKYGPMAAEEYFTGPHTALAQAKKPRNKKPKILIPRGKVTMQELYQKYSMRNSAGDNTLFFDIDDCVKLGSRPERYTDAHGNLTVPAYVIAYVSPDESHVYLQYMFFYGFNGPYTIKDPFFNKTLFEGDIIDFQNGHEADLEHIGMLIDRENQKLVMMFYGAHDKHEGVWVNPKQITYEDGHPVLYSAHGGHGLYPDPGIHVRVYGFANDLAEKGKRWVPEYSLVWAGKQFSMEQIKPEYAWVLFKGEYGRRGIASVINKSWFGDKISWVNNHIVIGENPGRSYADYKKFWCKDEACVQRVRWLAKPPRT